MRGILDAYRRAFEGIPREVWLLALVMLINRSGSMVLPFLSLYVHTQLHFDQVSAGMMIVFYGLGSSCGNFLGGMLTERLGAMRVQFLALLLNGIGFMFLSQMTSYPSFAVTLFFLSMVADAFRPANSAAITQFCRPETHRRAFALNRLAINLGFTIGPAIGGVLATFSYQWLFWVDAITCILAALALRWLLPVPKSSNERHAVRVPKKGVSPWGDVPFLFFCFLNIITYSVFFQLMSTFSLFLSDEYALREWQIGLLFGTNTIVVVMCEMLLVHAMQDWPPLKAIAWGSLLMCEGFAILSIGHGFSWAFLSVLIWTLGEMFAMPQGIAFVAGRADESRRGSYIGIYTTSIAIAFVLGPIAGAWCYGIDHYLFWNIAIPIGPAVFLGFMLLQAKNGHLRRNVDSLAAASEKSSNEKSQKTTAAL